MLNILNLKKKKKREINIIRGTYAQNTSRFEVFQKIPNAQTWVTFYGLFYCILVLKVTFINKCHQFYCFEEGVINFKFTKKH